MLIRYRPHEIAAERMVDNTGEIEEIEIWEARLTALFPASPLAMGVLLSALLIVLLLGSHAVQGHPIWITDSAGEGRLGNGATGQIIVALLIAYTLTAGRYLPKAIARDLQESGRATPPQDGESPGSEIQHYPIEVVRRSRYAGAAGVAVGLVLHAWSNFHLGGGPEFWYPEMIWSLLTMPLLGWLLARSAVFTVAGVSSAMQAPGFIPKVDLLDLRPHYATGRIGLRLALVWILGCSIFSLFLLHGQIGLIAVPMLAAGLAMAVVALILPVRDSQRRIHRVKLAELALVDRQLRGARDAALLAKAGAEGRLADLLGYRSYVESIREWPFDGSTFARFGLYLTIPLGSWVGGAFVERLLSSLLD